MKAGRNEDYTSTSRGVRACVGVLGCGDDELWKSRFEGIELKDEESAFLCAVNYWQSSRKGSTSEVSEEGETPGTNHIKSVFTHGTNCIDIKDRLEGVGREARDGRDEVTRGAGTENCQQKSIQSQLVNSHIT